MTLRWTGTGWADSNSWNLLINGITVWNIGNVDSENTVLWKNALSGNTTGFGNTAIGYMALSENTSGYVNTALGPWALYANTSGHSNIAVGTESR